MIGVVDAGELLVARLFEGNADTARGEPARLEVLSHAREPRRPLDVAGAGVVTLEDGIEDESDALQRQCAFAGARSSPENPFETGTSFGMSTWYRPADRSGLRRVPRKRISRPPPSLPT